MPNDFDFLFGRWRVAHRRLDARLAGCTTWTEFAGTCATWPLLGGRGNIDDNVLELPSGTYRAATLRSYDAASAQAAKRKAARQHRRRWGWMRMVGRTRWPPAALRAGSPETAPAAASLTRLIR